MSLLSLAWMDDAACRGRPVQEFFAFDDHAVLRRDGRAAYVAQQRLIRAVCRQCPVVIECRSHALRQPEEYGVWGGLTRRDRLRLYREQPAPGT